MKRLSRWRVTLHDPIDGRLYGTDGFVFKRSATRRAAFFDRHLRGMVVATVEAIQ